MPDVPDERPLPRQDEPHQNPEPSPRRRSGWKIAAGAAAGILGTAAAAGAGLFFLAGLIVRPRREDHSRALARWKKRWQQAGIAVLDTNTVSLDGTPISGWFLPGAGPLIVMLHGVNRSRLSVIRAARWLRRKGYSVLLLDLRGHGTSGGKYATYGHAEIDDVIHALSNVCGMTPGSCERIGLFGFSMGAAISIELATKYQAVACLWVDSPYASLREVSEKYAASFVPELIKPGARVMASITERVAEWRAQFQIAEREPARFAADVHCPAYVVHGTQDGLVEIEQGRKVYESLAGPKEFWQVEGADHICAMNLKPREYRKRLLKFFTTYLPLGSHNPINN